MPRAVAYRAQVPPGAVTSNSALSGKKFYLHRKKMSTNSQKFMMTFFSRLPKKGKFCTYRTPSAAPLFTCAAPSFPIFRSFIHIYKKCHLFHLNFYIFDVNFNIFPEVPPPLQVPPGATRSLCPRSVRHWARAALRIRTKDGNLR